MAQYLQLRELMSRLLPPLGTLVGLATLAFAAARQLQTEEDRVSPAVVLFFGAAGSAYVTSVYMLARQSMREWARSLTELVVPTDGNPADVLEKRTETAAKLGLSGSVMGELQTELWIVAPLLAGVGPFLSGE